MNHAQVRQLFFKPLRLAAEEPQGDLPTDRPRRLRTPAQLASDKRRSDGRRAAVEARYLKAREDLQKSRDEVNAARIAEGKAPFDFDAIAKAISRK